jgi:hypothetical protein
MLRGIGKEKERARRWFETGAQLCAGIYNEPLRGTFY